MKNFRSNSELAHAWANQTHDAGHASNFFFIESALYSYGKHYQVGQILTAPNGEKIALINKNGYSNSTAKHTNHAINAIPENVKSFLVPFCGINDLSHKTHCRRNEFKIESLPFIVAELLKESENTFNKQLKAISNGYLFGTGNKFYLTAVCLSEIFGMPVPELPKNAEKAREKSEKLIEKAVKQQQEDEKKQIEKQKILLDKWLKNEYNQPLYSLPIHLRVNGDYLETTKGACVPLKVAKEFFTKIKSGFDLVGEKIEGFTILANNSEFIQIGCHKISKATINDFFAVN